MIMSEIADKIRLLKKKFSVKTDLELAEKLRITVFAVRNWKQRGIIPTKYELLLTQEPTGPDNYSEKERQIIESFRKLPPERQDMYFHRILGDALEYETMTNPLGGSLSGIGGKSQKTS